MAWHKIKYAKASEELTHTRSNHVAHWAEFVNLWTQKSVSYDSSHFSCLCALTNITHRLDSWSSGVIQLVYELCSVGVIDVDGPLVTGADAVVRVTSSNNEVICRMPCGLQNINPNLKWTQLFKKDISCFLKSLKSWTKFVVFTLIKKWHLFKQLE